MSAKHIIFEGGHGSGKTLQGKRFLEYLNENGKETVYTFEPGGTEIADAIRKLVQGTVFEEDMDPLAEALLYAASRAQSYSNIVVPSINKGINVISDRSFLSSAAIQGYVRELTIEKALEVNRPVIDLKSPDIIVYIDMPIEESIKRNHDHGGDRFENEELDFFKKMVEGYMELSKLDEFKDKWVFIDGGGTPDEVFERIVDEVVI